MVCMEICTLMVIVYACNQIFLMLLMIHCVIHGVSDKSRNLLIKPMYRFQFLNLVKIPNSVRLNHDQTSTYTHNNQNGHAPGLLEPK